MLERDAGERCWREMLERDAREREIDERGTEKEMLERERGGVYKSLEEVTHLTEGCQMKETSFLHIVANLKQKRCPFMTTTLQSFSDESKYAGSNCSDSKRRQSTATLRLLLFNVLLGFSFRKDGRAQLATTQSDTRL